MPNRSRGAACVVLALIAAIVVVGCASKATTSSDSTDGGSLPDASSLPDAITDASADTALCRIPDGSNTFSDAAQVGCFPRQGTWDTCEVPPGAIVYGDGAAAFPDGAAVPCRSLCATTEYAMYCEGLMSKGPDGVPLPPAALHCRDVEIPAENRKFLCCTCAP